MLGGPTACIALFLACGTSDNAASGSADAGACRTNADCASGLSFVYPFDTTCTALGARTFVPDSAVAWRTYCGCDGRDDMPLAPTVPVRSDGPRDGGDATTPMR